ncbi:MAG: 4Fe-4S binding protein [Clostridiales Family XIII bacterium]|nr:4Fe-4S binding protein [Clostridiales Family XIII bacterium]
MAINPIDQEKCIACSICVISCPCDIIRCDKETKKAQAVYPEDCMCCAACEDDCPVGAIYVSPEKNDPLMVSFR